ncbi:sodium:solute symporter family transporter, partial [Proteus mirabilis]
LIFGISIALNTAIGGFRASVLNVALQGLVMLLGSFILLFAIINKAGGLDIAIQKQKAIDPALPSPQGAD